MVKAKIRSFFNKQENKTIVSNFLFLSVLQGLNLFLPLLTLPYLNRIIGIEYVGLLAFAMALSNYFQVFVDYGFNLTAPKDVAQNIDDKEKLKLIYNDVMTSKLILLLLSGAVFSGLIFSFDVLYKERLVYFLTFAGMVVGYSLFPVWFFQGVQKMKYITYINVFTKLLFTAAIFIFIKHKQDYWMIPLFTSSGFILSGLISLLYIKRSFNIKYGLSPLSRVKTQLFVGKYVFLSQIKITLFSTTNTIILRALCGEAAVGYFSNAEKIMRALAGLQIPVVNALYPYMSKLIIESKAEAYKKIRVIGIYGSLIYLVVITILFVFSYEVTALVFGPGMEQTAQILRILLLIPVFILLNNLYGTQILINLGKDRIFFNILLVTAVLNLLLIVPLTYYYKALGTGISVFITELFLCIAMYYYAIKQKTIYDE